MRKFLRNVTWVIFEIVMMLLILVSLVIGGFIVILGGIVITPIIAVGAAIQGDDMIESVCEYLGYYIQGVSEGLKDISAKLES